MVSLRRQKIKAKRSGVDPKTVDACVSHSEVVGLMPKQEIKEEVTEEEQADVGE